MNSKKSNMLYVIFIFIIIILIVIGIVQLYSKFSKSTTFTSESDKSMGIYDVQMPIKGNGQNMNNCLKGCVRGSCNKSEKGCKYDFQCQYCQDTKSNMFYVEFNDERHILPLYQEEEQLSALQDMKLNKMIMKNNQYIDLLNQKIIKMNS